MQGNWQCGRQNHLIGIKPSVITSHGSLPCSATSTELRLFKRSQVPAFPARVTMRKVFCWGLSQLDLKFCQWPKRIAAHHGNRYQLQAICSYAGNSQTVQSALRGARAVICTGRLGELPRAAEQRSLEHLIVVSSAGWMLSHWHCGCGGMSI